MRQTARSRRGMVTSPHHLASQAGLDVLKQGGTAVEAAVATAAALAVVYPHMTGIGGDAFWLISEPGKAPIGIDACGRAAAAADLAYYASKGVDTIPYRGPLAANTVAGTISGYDAALKATAQWQSPLDRATLLDAAIHYAETGAVVTRSQAELTAEKFDELGHQPGFAATYMPSGKPPAEGDVLKQPALAKTLRLLATEGFDSFYRGSLARLIAADLAAVGSPVTADDLARHQPLRTEALSVRVSGATLYNMPPPTQGVSALTILALFDRLGVTEPESFAHVHGLVESTKQAFLVRDRHVGDPDYMTVKPADLLTDASLDAQAAKIDPQTALPWPYVNNPGDTIWLGVIDDKGRSVSMIQSVFFEFGSGVVLPETGICWQNRGCSFKLAETGSNALKPNRKPFHTLNPAMAEFDDGRRMVYGTMGGDGQPQTQAAVFSRYGFFKTPLQQAITAPRWLLGKTWGDDSVTLKIESRFPAELIAQLKAAGHTVEVLDEFTNTMGHAGAIALWPNGVLEGATDPRSDGGVAAW